MHFWFLTIYAEGVRYAVLMAVRVMALIAGTSLLTYTTSPIVLTDAIEQLLKPLGKLHFPVHELAMMMSIALRFIPTLIEETDKIMNAQKARGAQLDTGKMTDRVKALVPVLIRCSSRPSAAQTSWLWPRSAAATAAAQAAPV